MNANLGLNEIYKTRIILICLVLLGLFARLFAARFEWLNMDEGCYINDANMVLSGMIPIKDFFSREPLFPILLSLSYGYLGRTLFAARLLSVFAGSIIIFALYAIGTRIFNRKIGILAAAIYALSPYTIDWGVLLKTEVISSMFVTLAILALAIYIKNARNIFLLISGLLFGFSFLIRRSAIMALFIPLIILICKYQKSKESIITRISLVFLGFFMTAGSSLVYLISITDLRWIWNILGFGELIHPSQLLIIRLVVFWSAFMLLFYMILPCIPFVINYIPSAFRHLRKSDSKTLSSFVASILCLLIIAISVGGTSAMNFLNIYGYGIFYVPVEINLVFIALTMLALASLISIWPLIKPRKKVSIGDTLVIVWLLSYVVLYAFYPSLFTDYFNEFSPSLSLAAALGLSKMIDACVKYKHPNLKYPVVLFFLVLIFSAIFVTVFVIGHNNPYNRSNVCVYGTNPYNFWDRSWDPSFVQEIADYIASSTRGDEEIFTADTVFVSLAQRRVVYNISYPHHYIDFGREKPISYDPYNLTFSVDEIIDRMETKRIRLVIVGPRTLLMFQKHPELQLYTELKYELIRVFGDPACIASIRIYARTPDAEEKVEIFEDFSKCNATRDWITICGNWNFANGTLSSAWGSPDWRYRALMLLNSSVPDSFMVKVGIKILGEAGVVLRYQDNSNYYLIRIISSPNFEGLQFIKVLNGTEYEISSKYEKILKDALYYLEIITIHNRFIIHVNSTLQLTAFDETFEDGSLGLSCNYGANFDNFYVTNDYIKLIYLDAIH